MQPTTSPNTPITTQPLQTTTTTPIPQDSVLYETTETCCTGCAQCCQSCGETGGTFCCLWFCL